MTQAAHSSSVKRLAIAGGIVIACVLAIFFAFATIESVLRWIDLLFPKPGLSGIVLVLLSPVLFLLVAAGLRWAWEGFGARTQDSDPPKSG
tara:strand:+ start:96 stop:368 length:273 start_codon:yes stop_codon:yes gene_type:complete